MKALLGLGGASSMTGLPSSWAYLTLSRTSAARSPAWPAGVQGASTCTLRRTAAAQSPAWLTGMRGGGGGGLHLHPQTDGYCPGPCMAGRCAGPLPARGLLEYTCPPAHRHYRLRSLGPHLSSPVLWGFFRERMERNF